MSKELEYEVNNFANLLHKDCMNLMECLKKQGEDNKPILYLGKHYEKVILPYEEYQKMCNRLEAIDNANPSEALECLEYMGKTFYVEIADAEGECTVYAKNFNGYDTIEQALLKAQENARSEEILQKHYEEGITLDSVRALKQEKDYYKKALEIIKEKNVNMFGFKRDIKQLGKRFTYKYYQSNLGNYHSGFDIQELTEEEFSLLKAVLE